MQDEREVALEMLFSRFLDEDKNLNLKINDVSYTWNISTVMPLVKEVYRLGVVDGIGAMRELDKRNIGKSKVSNRKNPQKSCKTKMISNRRLKRVVSLMYDNGITTTNAECNELTHEDMIYLLNTLINRGCSYSDVLNAIIRTNDL